MEFQIGVAHEYPGTVCDMKTRIRMQDISRENDMSKDVTTVITNLFDYMIEKRLRGCCYSFSSALYVALSELGEHPLLCVGECLPSRSNPFDHSWIELNGKILDIAVYMPLVQKTTGVVIAGIDTATLKKVDTVYGYVTGMGLGPKTREAIDAPFVQYMNKFPFEQGGLWSLVKKILPGTFKFDINEAKREYANTKRVYIAKEMV